MKAGDKTKEQLVKELVQMRQRVAELEKLETERKRAGEALRRSEERYRNIFESSKDVIYVCDAEGQLLDVNPAVVNVLGYSEEELAKIDLAETNADPKQREEFRKRLERDGYVSMELQYRHKDGTIKTVHEVSVAIKDAAGRLTSYHGIFRDITEQKKIERLKSEFISTVSHELRTPLTSIKGYADLLLAGDAGELNGTQEEFLRVIVRNSDRLTKLINDLLDIEKIESGERKLEFRELELDEILQDVVETFTVNAEEKGLSFQSELEDGIRVKGDADCLSQAFANLLSNAIKYTKQGSVKLRTRCEGGRAVVQIEDSGIGMSKEEQAQLFRRFFRADNSYVKEAGGSGLGLSIVKATIERHGGEITVESEPNRGSTFTISLPLSSSWTELEDAGEVERPTVLIIEDDGDIASLIKRYIEKMGYQAVVALSGSEGIERAGELEPALITLDILMPEMDGFEVIKQLKAQEGTSSIPVVFISIVQDKEKGLKLGASAYLTKPIDEQRLKGVIAQLIKTKVNPILIVDDDPDFCELMGRLLKREGLRAESAYDGEEALRMIYNKQYQLILLDKNLPRKSGLEVLVQLRANGISSEVPVIMISGSPGAEEIEKEIRVLGAKKFLSKRLEAKEVVKEILKYIKEGRHGNKEDFTS